VNYVVAALASRKTNFKSFHAILIVYEKLHVGRHDTSNQLKDYKQRIFSRLTVSAK
jgi:hypothetical protein